MKKLAIFFGSIFGLIVLILVLVPLLFKDQIADAVKTEANQSMAAQLDFSDYSLNLIRHFPHFTFSMEGVSLVETPENGADTLARFQKLGLTIDLFKAISGEYELTGLELNEALLAVEFDEAGRMNWDIFPTSEEMEEESQSEDSEGLSIQLSRIQISNTSLYYTDMASKMQFLLKGLDLDGKGEVNGDEVLLNADIETKSVSFMMEGESYLDPLPLNVSTSVLLNLATSKYTIQDLAGSLASLALNGKGYVQLNDEDMDFDLSINTVNSTFEQLITVVPSSFSSMLEGMELKGDASIQFDMKGKMNETDMPGMDIFIKTKNATAAYSGYPELVEQLNMSLYAGMPQGPLEGFSAKLSNGTFQLAGASADLTFFAKDFFTDPYLKAGVNVDLSLKDVKQYVPEDVVSDIQGDLSIKKLSLETRMSAIEKEQYDKVKFGGRVIGNNLKVASNGMLPLSIKTVDLTANPSAVSISMTDFKFGNTQFSATGSAQQFLPYLLKDETIKLALVGNAKLIDVTELMAMMETEGEDSEEAVEETDSEIFIPSNIYANLQLAAQKIVYDSIPITNAKASIVLDKSILKIQQLKAEGLGGTLQLSGRVDGSQTPLKYNLGYSLKNLSIREAVNQIAVVKELAPITQYLEGKFSSELGVSGALTEGGDFDLTTLSAEGLFDVLAAKVQDFPPLARLGERMKWKAIKNFEVVQQLIEFKAENGRVDVKPFNFNAGNSKIEAQGSHGFDQTIDYTLNIQLPLKEARNTGLDVTKAVASAEKLGVKVKDDDQVTVKVKIGGSIDKPKIELEMLSDLKSKAKDAINDEVDNVKNAAKNAAEDAKNSAKDAFRDIFKGEKSADEAASDFGSKADSLKKKAKESTKNWKKKIPW